MAQMFCTGSVRLLAVRCVSTLILVATVSVCFVLPAHAGLFSVSEHDEIAIGRQAAVQVEQKAPMLRNSRIQAYISRLGLELAGHSRRPHLPWRFRVIKDKNINAFALPGGFIYVHSKILELAKTEAELASVIAHEIGHVEGFHHKAQIERAMRYQFGLGMLGAVMGRGQGADYAMVAGKLLAQGQLTRYSREAESDADRRGVLLLSSTGYNPMAMSSFLENLVKLDRSQPGILSGFFRDHPAASDRVTSTQVQASAIPAGVWRRDSPDFQALVRGGALYPGESGGALIKKPANAPFSGGWKSRVPSQEGALIRP